jgi:hypothetical protein
MDCAQPLRATIAREGFRRDIGIRRVGAPRRCAKSPASLGTLPLVLLPRAASSFAESSSLLMVYSDSLPADLNQEVCDCGGGDGDDEENFGDLHIPHFCGRNALRLFQA